MPHNERSKTISQGNERAPNRAMFRALGYTSDDFDKPMIGIANGHSTITPAMLVSNRWPTPPLRRSRRRARMPRFSVCPRFPTACPWARKA
ncbi:hypothetical protein [Neoaquamicrobium sediminum]|uniref:hypothetical protein n=1 Tax=Neoaquamicrobium sediminum TaxID=1849104 RepID=UPI001FD5A7AA|nr:hypothetical protein [Mesorhizobium sediminum]